MRIVFALVLILGVALAGGAVYFASQQFNANQSRIAELTNRIAKNVEMVEVYVAATELKYGQILTKEVTAQVPQEIIFLPHESQCDSLGL